jgi:hypothetical protein
MHRYVYLLVWVTLLMNRYVYLLAPSFQWVSWPLLSEALRFPTFLGTMGSYDCSPTLPCRLRFPPGPQVLRVEGLTRRI